MKNQLFSELNGFVLYNPYLLQRYLHDNDLKSADILSYFTETKHGDIITKEGIAIPILKLPSDYYQFNLLNQLPTEFLLQSQGWIIHGEGGKIQIAGIGYMREWNSINEQNSVVFSVEQKWAKLSIVSYYDNEIPNIGLMMRYINTKPIFKGDIETDYEFYH